MNSIIIDTVCKEIIDLLTLYPTWHDQDECLSGYDERMQYFCQRIEEVSEMNMSHNLASIQDFYQEFSFRNNFKVSLMSIQDLFVELVPEWYHISHGTYNSYRNAFGDAYSEVLLGIPVICKVNTATDITIFNETFLPIDEQLYQVEFNVTGSRLIHITIRNNTFKNLFFHLNNIKSSVNIKGNVFIGSGIKIMNEVKDSAVSIVTENNIFRGNYKRTVVELHNIKNVSFKNNDFENLYSHLYRSTGVLCHSTDIELHHISFKNVRLNTIVKFDDCLVKMTNVSMVESPLSHLVWIQIAVLVEKTNGTFSDMSFVQNNGTSLFAVQKGELLMQNINFNGNSLCRYHDNDAMISAEESHIVLIGVNAVRNRKILTYIDESLAIIPSLRWLHNSGGENLVTVFGSYFRIYNSLFENNYFHTLFLIYGRSQVEISNCSFTRNKATLISNEILYGELVISSCRFEENMHTGNSLIKADYVFTQI